MHYRSWSAVFIFLHDRIIVAIVKPSSIKDIPDLFLLWSIRYFETSALQIKPILRVNIPWSGKKRLIYYLSYKVQIYRRLAQTLDIPTQCAVFIAWYLSARYLWHSFALPNTPLSCCQSDDSVLDRTLINPSFVHKHNNIKWIRFPRLWAQIRGH